MKEEKKIEINRDWLVRLVYLADQIKGELQKPNANEHNTNSWRNHLLGYIESANLLLKIQINKKNPI